MSGLLSIGLTGLNAAQAQLLTTGHNITNAGVEGYHRQTVIQKNATPQFTGAGFFGKGTQIAAVTRSYNEFLEGQVLNASTKVAEYTAYNQQINQINNLLADASSGLSSVMEGFFAGVQEVASNPTSVAARQALISSAEALVSRFKTMDARLTEVREGVEGEIKSTVAQINMMAGAIAEMNRRIAQSQVAGPSVAANDLLDQREQLVAELNKLVKTSTVVESDGSLSVFIGTGQGLVVGNTANTLGAVQNPNDPQRTAIALVAQNGIASILPESLITGGTLGGLLAFRAETLDTAQNTLGQIAIGLAVAFNSQHTLGVDLSGVLGKDFFAVPEIAVMPLGAASVSYDAANIAGLTSSDYELRNVGGVFTLKRLADGAEFAATPPVAPATDYTFTQDGLNIAVSAATLANGQTALIQPTRYAARDIGVAISDPREIAAGGAVSVEAPLSNLGNGAISNIRVLDVSGMPVTTAGVPDFGDLSLSFAGVNDYTLSLTSSSGATVALTPATYSLGSDTQGRTFTATVTPDPLDPATTYTFEFTLSGSPTGTDTFRFSPTQAGTADNRNAVALGALQTSKQMLASADGTPTATFQSVYAQMVTQVGNKTREVQVNLKAQESLLNQATDARDSLSGVNLDEEAANLIRYQQAYQAAAKVMSVAQTMFDEVLSIAR